MSRTLSCLIVDDEPSARDVISRYIEDTPHCSEVGSCSNAIEAMEFLEDHRVDVIFLDINMPKLSGISFLKSLDHPPAVIITSAYEDYALEGYELDVVDYLLKPFSFERFLKAVNKVKNHIDDSISHSKLSIKTDGKIYKVDPADILYIEAMGDYVSIHTKENKRITHNTLKKLEKLLPAGQFIRVHKSYIVNVGHIDYLEGNTISIGKTTVPIGGTYRDEVIPLLS